jgi:hypothetical protein
LPGALAVGQLIETPLPRQIPSARERPERTFCSPQSQALANCCATTLTLAIGLGQRHRAKARTVADDSRNWLPHRKVQLMRLRLITEQLISSLFKTFAEYKYRPSAHLSVPVTFAGPIRVKKGGSAHFFPPLIAARDLRA